MKITNAILDKYRQKLKSIDDKLFLMIKVDKTSIFILKSSPSLTSFSAEILTDDSFMTVKTKKNFSKVKKIKILEFNSIYKVTVNPKKFGVTFHTGKDKSFEILSGNIREEKPVIPVLRQIINNSRNLTADFFKKKVKDELVLLEKELSKKLPIFIKNNKVETKSPYNYPEGENEILHTFQQFLIFLALYALRKENFDKEFFLVNFKKTDLFYGTILIRFLSIIPAMKQRISIESNSVSKRQEEMRVEELCYSILDIISLREIILELIAAEFKPIDNFSKWNSEMGVLFFIKWKKIIGKKDRLLTVLKEAYQLGHEELKEVIEIVNS